MDGPFPRQHPREVLVRQAENKLRLAVAEATRDLTTGEGLRVVMTVLGDEIGGIAKFMIRVERHGNTDMPGGLE